MLNKITNHTLYPIMIAKKEIHYVPQSNKVNANM